MTQSLVSVCCVDIAWQPCYHAKMIQSFASPGIEDIFNVRDSIRINDQYRIRFAWSDEGAADAAIVDYPR